MAGTYFSGIAANIRKAMPDIGQRSDAWKTLLQQLHEAARHPEDPGTRIRPVKSTGPVGAVIVDSNALQIAADYLSATIASVAKVYSPDAVTNLRALHSRLVWLFDREKQKKSLNESPKKAPLDRRPRSKVLLCP